MGRKIAVQDIPYHIFMGSFHNLEESYQEILARNIIASDRKVFSTLDRLHHRTISILANQYFNVRDATVFALAKLADSRDPETGKHLLRTREYSKIITMEMGHSNELIDYMYKMSPLHDIGKVGISDKILLKPGPLDKEEFNEMKKHVDIGGNTIDAIIGSYKVTKGYLRIAKEIASYHHEKYDGNGYKRLKGQQIPLPARVFIICDIYDALTSKRCYKEPYTHERACSIIIDGDGRTKPKDFDPKVLSAFIRRQDDFHKVSQQYID
jgi:putative two-component system response regulator